MSPITQTKSAKLVSSSKMLIICTRHVEIKHIYIALPPRCMASHETLHIRTTGFTSPVACCQTDLNCRVDSNLGVVVDQGGVQSDMVS
jgi:hypothetical protein